jgi:enoyl-CoA hydratase/carnithine racemase
MTGDLLSATEAVEFGLLNDAVSDEQAEDVALELARLTTVSAPGSLQSIRDIWTDIEDDFGAVWLSHVVGRLSEQLKTIKGRNGLPAFLNDETPAWER